MRAIGTKTVIFHSLPRLRWSFRLIWINAGRDDLVQDGRNGQTFRGSRR
jgi:hypothetical protein